jgi:hypothetical protein
MKLSFLRFPLVATMLLAGLPLAAPAQPVRTGKEKPAPVSPAPTLADAIQFREKLAADVASGTEKPAAAWQRLVAHKNAMGLGLSDESDLALAATDVGQRLVAAGKPEAAELFFRGVEESVDTSLQRKPGAGAREKADWLAQRAWVRAKYLNKVTEADADLAEAVHLQPDDARLKKRRDQLSTERNRRGDKEQKGGRS